MRPHTDERVAAEPVAGKGMELTRAPGRLRKALLGMSLDQASFARRQFRENDPGARERLEEVGRTFLRGYHAALLDDAPDRLAERLGLFEADVRGFAFEGAGMGLALLDYLTPWRGHRLLRFIAGPGGPHIYMLHVGAGVALARIPWLRRRPDRPLTGLDPLLRWLIVDGYGFHEGYFHWRRYASGGRHPRGLTGYARRAFDQGLGRSIWFVEGAAVDRISPAIAAFPAGRQGDLWSGVGLACAYAGGVDRGAIEHLRRAAGPHSLHLAQGAAFAAKARQRAGNPASHTELACDVLCETSAEIAARITDVALGQLATGGSAPVNKGRTAPTWDDPEPAYERWREYIRTHFAEEKIRS